MQQTLLQSERDIDNDTHLNIFDAFPQSIRWVDSDYDGVGDNSDSFPMNPYEQHDTDSDGVGIMPMCSHTTRTNILILTMMV